MRRPFRIALLIFVLMVPAFPGCFAQENSKEIALRFVESQEYHKAIELMEKAVNADSGDTESWKLLARLYAYVQEYEKSLEIYEELLERFPDDGDILFGAAQTHSWKGDYGIAEEYYKKVISQAPEYVDAYKGLANVYFWQQNYTPARKTLLDALNLQPTDPELLSLLVQVYYNLGDSKKTQYYNNLLLSYDPDSEIGLRYKDYFKYFNVEVGGGYDRVSTQQDWKEGNISLQYKPGNHFTGIIRLASYDRFGRKDNQASLSLVRRLTNKFTLAALAGIGTEKEFLPETRFNLECSYAFERLVIMFGGQYMRFPVEDVNVYLGGVEYYFPAGFFADYKYYYSEGEQNNTSSTHMARLHYFVEQRYHLFIGIAAGGEAFQFASRDELFITESTSYMGAITYWLNSTIGFKILLSYADRKNSYTRLNISSGIFVNF